MTRSPARNRTTTAAFIAFSFALAFWQRPGWATTDTKIDLHVDPARFLSFVSSVWTATTDLGEVHSSQYAGYLWPMGPAFTALHAIGLSAWVAQRVWLGLVFALAAWGMLRLMDIVAGPRRGAAHVVAAFFFVLNPYTVVFTGRTSSTLLGYAALPWLLIVCHRGMRCVRGLRDWRGWWWATAFGLIVTSIGAGVNAAVVGWMLFGPLLLLAYEPLIGAVPWRRALNFLLRAAILATLVSLWWLLPLLVATRYGIDFLKFTEQPSSIWGTNSVSEALRLMSYWTSYIGYGFGGVQRSLYGDSATMLFNPLVVVASLLAPALAVAAFAAARRWRYAPFLMLMIVAGVLIMTAGFPDGTPLRKLMDAAYRSVAAVRFMRTTQKAAPLVACGVAGLLGIGAQLAWQWLRAWRPAAARGRRARPALIFAAPVLLAALIALAALPLIRGGALDPQVGFKRIPAAWVRAGHDLDAQLTRNSRALVLPGQIFAFYRWGGTVDAILPRLTSRPVAVRYETPYSDLHADDLLATVDDLIQQRRVVPGQLTGLLQLMSVGAVVTGTDDDISRSGAVDPAAAAGELALGGLRTPARRYGPARAFAPAAGDLGPSLRLSQVRRYDVPVTRGLVAVDAAGPPTIVDGSAAGLADLSAFGALPNRAPLFYAGDIGAAAIRRAAAAGAHVVITDSNRRQQFLAQYAQQNLGPVLAPGDPLASSSATTDPFAGAGPDAQTVSTLRGAASLSAVDTGGTLAFPENAPIAAFDGDLSTAWVADRYAPPGDRYLQIGFLHPRDVPYVDLYPLDGRHETVSEVDVNGIRRHVGPGWTRVATRLHHVSVLRVAIDHVIQPRVGLGGPGGFREIRIPGFGVEQLLRTPLLAARALAGRDLRHAELSYAFERQTGDRPFARNRYRISPVLDELQGAGDAEAQIARVTVMPATRAYRAQAWVNPALAGPDPALDRIAGVRGADRFSSSSRFEDVPADRASSAFDGRSATAWIGDWRPGEAPNAWIAFATPRPLTVSHLRLRPAAQPVAAPSRVRLSWPGGATPVLAVGAGGEITLPRPARARRFRLEVISAAEPAGATARRRAAAAVGIGELSVPGLRPVAVPRRGPLAAGCGSVRVSLDGRTVAMRVSGTLAAFDAGVPLRAVACGAPVTVAAGIAVIRSLPGPFSVDLLRLDSPAPSPLATAAAAGAVTDPGTLRATSLTGVRLALGGPAWLVLGESFDRGWRATCDGRALGAPQPIDGYANGWLAPAGCHAVSIRFAPQALADHGYLVSAVIGGLLVLALLGGWVAARTQLVPASPRASLAEPPPRRLGLPAAVTLAAVLAVPLGFVFALRAGAVAFPLLAVVLWRGWGPSRLVRLAALLLGVVVPLIYVLFTPRNLGGYNFNYSVRLIAAHWVGVAAIVLLALATGRMLIAQRAGRPAGRVSRGRSWR